jgi:hypothetical protein
VWLLETEPADERGQGVRVPVEPEIVGRVERPPAARGIPGHSRELVGQCIELEIPLTAVPHGAVKKHERRAVAATLVRDTALRKPDEAPGQAVSGAVAVTIHVEAMPQIVPSSRWNSANDSRSAASTVGRYS